VRARFGDEVHERLVDPLVGSIYAADTDHFSLAAVPQIFDLASRSRSVLIAGRRMPKPSPTAGPVFYAPRAGMGAMATAVHDAVVTAGGTVHTGRAITELASDGAGWRVDGDHFDAVVLASPAAVTAELLSPVAPESAAIVQSITAADVVMVTLAIPSASWPTHLNGMSGYLVPKPAQRLVTAVSFGSQKWSHWAADDSLVLRISLGRDGLPILHLRDDELLAAAVAETSQHVGVDLAPNQFRITRWEGAFPQYRPQHASRVQRAEAQLPAGLAVCGASFHGIGIPACIRSAQTAAGVTLRHLQSLAG
jgi:oxygen-dependent protoporphyrinogen oxidase